MAKTPLKRGKPGYHSMKDVHHDVHDVHDDCGKISTFRRVLPQILAVCVKNLVMFGFGLTLGFPTIVIPALKVDMQLTDEQTSWISSLNLLCVTLGCFLSGAFTEIVGKRRAMQIIEVPVLVSWCLFYFATNVYELYIGLCLAGIGGGLMESSVLTYVAEITEAKYRGTLTASGTTCVIIGILTQFVFGTFLPLRTIAAICAVLPIAIITALQFVPESPYWLIAKNRIDDAKQSLAWLRGWTTVDRIDDEFMDIHRAILQKRRRVAKESRIKPYTRRTFLVPFAIVHATMFIGCFGGKTTLQTFAVGIFEQLNTPLDKYHATVLLGVAELIGATLCVILVRFTGKRPLVFVSLIVCGLCFASIAFYAAKYPAAPVANGTKVSVERSTDVADVADVASPNAFVQLPSEELAGAPDQLDRGEPKPVGVESADRPYAWLPLVLLPGAALFIHVGIGLVPWMLIGEMYPTNIRSGSSSISIGSGYLFAFAANKLYLRMVAMLTLPGLFWCNAAVSAAGCVLIYFILPETEGRTLVEIETFFARKKTLPR